MRESETQTSGVAIPDIITSSTAAAMWSAMTFAGLLTMVSACGTASRPFHPSSVYEPPEAGAACTELGCPLGFVAAPQRLTANEELQREFDRCLAIGSSPDCVRDAFATVKKSQGLDQRPPTGTVTIRKLPPDEAEN